jgi:hypothetical protein
MKKLLVVLLVLCVSLVALFAEEGVISTRDLTLNGEVEGVLVHGFNGSVFTTKSQILSRLDGNVEGEGDLEVDVNLRSNDAQTIGYYAFYSNLISQSTVTFTSSFVLTKGPLASDNSTWEVPFRLGIEKIMQSPSAGRTFNDSNFSNPSSAAAGRRAGISLAADQDIELFTTTGSGLGYRAYKLSARFDGDGNDILPEGDDYTETIVATCTTI